MLPAPAKCRDRPPTVLRGRNDRPHSSMVELRASHLDSPVCVFDLAVISGTAPVARAHSDRLRSQKSARDSGSR